MYRFLGLLAISFVLCTHSDAATPVTPGIDVLLTRDAQLLKHKRVALLTNHTGMTGNMEWTLDAMMRAQETLNFKLVAVFAPEHGLTGSDHAGETVKDARFGTQIPVHSLHGKTRRPTDAMLRDIDVIVYDIQDVGARSYTYISTLFYVMEEAAQRHIRVVVADRPNPINGLTIDGPMLNEKWRSFVGYIDVPYIHGMTIGELAKLFNAEYKVGCDLVVVPMRAWSREMSYKDTGLLWVPTSPQIPESDTPMYYPATGILGELGLVSIGVGYTLPFKVIGAPWIDRVAYAQHLNAQGLNGVHFQPFTFKPFFGKFKGSECHGVRVVVTDSTKYRPVTTQYMLMGILKSMYPERFQEALEKVQDRVAMFNKVNGTDEVYSIVQNERYIAWKLAELHHERRARFVEMRRQYLIY